MAYPRHQSGHFAGGGGKRRSMARCFPALDTYALSVPALARALERIWEELRFLGIAPSENVRL
jgi:hypothetical protein